MNQGKHDGVLEFKNCVRNPIPHQIHSALLHKKPTVGTTLRYGIQHYKIVEIHVDEPHLPVDPETIIHRIVMAPVQC